MHLYRLVLGCAVQDCLRKGRSPVSESEVPKLQRDVIRDGRIVSSKIKIVCGREGYERIHEYNGERLLLTGIGLIGFLVSAFTLKNRKAH